MAFRILYTEDALADLQVLLDYIRADNPTAAERFGNALLNHVDLLGSFPHMGSPVAQRPGVRKVLHTPVRIYYQLQEDRQIVEILHFWHVARQRTSL